jgi:hypothetical protein
MTDITPPPELVQQWVEEADTFRYLIPAVHQYIATRAAQWGADQELDACCERLTLTEGQWELAANLRAVRRPKTLSLKEQALKALDEALFMADDVPPEGICSDQVDIIRRALEQLDG